MLQVQKKNKIKTSHRGLVKKERYTMMQLKKNGAVPKKVRHEVHKVMTVCLDDSISKSGCRNGVTMKQ